MINNNNQYWVTIIDRACIYNTYDKNHEMEKQL